MSASGRNACRTLLLPVPRDRGQVPARPRKCSQDSVAAASQGLWKIITHNLALVFTLNDLAPVPVNVATFQGLLGLGGFNSLYQMSFKQWNRFSLCGPENLPDPTLFLGIHPSHQSTARYRAADFQTMCSPCLQS